MNKEELILLSESLDTRCCYLSKRLKEQYGIMWWDIEDTYKTWEFKEMGEIGRLSVKINKMIRGCV